MNCSTRLLSDCLVEHSKRNNQETLLKNFTRKKMRKIVVIWWGQRMSLNFLSWNDYKMFKRYFGFDDPILQSTVKACSFYKRKVTFISLSSITIPRLRWVLLFYMIVIHLTSPFFFWRLIIKNLKKKKRTWMDCNLLKNNIQISIKILKEKR